MDGSQRQNRETVAEVAARLPWLVPSAGALERLAAEPVPLDELSTDPAIVLLALRFVRPSSTPETFTFRSLRDSVVAESAARLLEAPAPHRFDLSRESVRAIGNRSRSLAAAARSYAIAKRTCSPDAAAALALVSPLGELAIASVSPDGPFDGADAVARRLAHRWRLPDWVAATISTARLPLADAVRLGADPELARMLREIVPIPVPIATSEADDEDPHSIRLLSRLLRSAAQGRRLANDHRLRAAEAESDRLHELLAEVRDDFEIAVRDAKLSGLAELAAGAGHEINNPLAIISGHVQRLRKAEDDADRVKVLETVLRQTDRISDIVRELMLFARPAVPGRTTLDPTEWIAELIEDLEPEAGERGITLAQSSPDAACQIECDPGQLRKILRNLLRNAVEATPDGGQVRIATTAEGGAVRIAIEDDGPGPRDEAVPHLFDPFFSGRSAGRGRGLGLATAWRLVSINGGDLQYHREPQGPTRFVLEFPAPKPVAPPLRIPA
jgi:two-component system, NtrC family, sensor kinase